MLVILLHALSMSVCMTACDHHDNLLNDQTAATTAYCMARNISVELNLAVGKIIAEFYSPNI